MIITGIETVPLRIPFKAGTKSDASAWGDSNLPAADSLLVKVCGLCHKSLSDPQPYGGGTRWHGRLARQAGWSRFESHRGGSRQICRRGCHRTRSTQAGSTLAQK